MGLRRLLLTALLGTVLSIPAQAAPDCAQCPDMMPVPGGTLIRSDGTEAEITPFLMGATEVTFDQFQLCVDAGACRADVSDRDWGRGNRPVINVTHADARAYARWLQQTTGLPYRLPTEDEWEWAARGGTTTRFWWGNEPGQMHANCRYCGPADSGKRSMPVASFPPNAYGLYDTAGNVIEWVDDCWADRRDTPPQKRDCAFRVAKGGAWYYVPEQARPDNRIRQREDLWSYTVGFRIAR
ncbi:formylglycine-generating enzyme family protein [Novispirillum itersonii]|uniref:Formylglycine-generating enzyme required for sulfatase activity n=1 Tax=Novispirillum itersonii TaxID=189 RepID=A0A7W9ZKD7_NOVIT|nr:SUMF1/EgtB/PvdO family nonheme iron enzyme [Novispirillum itersonii]MBB6212097.1 formylglycine-generating enzyme required for sulfatase activity [Novispirillum itersonii]